MAFLMPNDPLGVDSTAGVVGSGVCIPQATSNKSKIGVMSFMPVIIVWYKIKALWFLRLI